MVESSRLRTLHVMMVLFLSSDVFTVSVDMTKGGVSWTVVSSYPPRPLKIFCPLALQCTSSPTNVQLNVATPLSKVFTDWGELVISVWEGSMKQIGWTEILWWLYINNLPFYNSLVIMTRKTYNSQYVLHYEECNYWWLPVYTYIWSSLSPAYQVFCMEINGDSAHFASCTCSLLPRILIMLNQKKASCFSC